MTTTSIIIIVILYLLNIAAFIILIVGLLKPALILRWTKKPTRLKVFGYWSLTTIILVGFMLIASLMIPKENSNDDILNKTKTSIDNTNEEYSFNKSENQEVSNEDTIKLKESIEREINSINKGIDFSKYQKSHESLKWELILFNVWAQRIEEGENSDDIDVQNLAEELKNKVIAIQIKEFPKLRKLFLKYGKQQAATKTDTNIKMSIDGSDNGYINFIDEIFMLESQAKILHETIESTLIDYRFRQARYKKYEGDEGYIYYDLNSPYDREIHYKNL